jgi:PAS domain S-box-containing protein
MNVPDAMTTASPGSDRGEPLPRRIQWFMTALGLYAAAGGLVSLAGWAADVRRLTDWYDNGISIQPNTTVAVTLSGLAVVLLAWGRRRAAVVLAFLVGGIGATVLWEWFSGVDLGIDTLLMFDRTWGRVGVVSPGRMGPPGATSWTLIGTALLLISVSRQGSRARTGAMTLAMITSVIAAFSVIGYLYGAELLYTMPRLTVIAMQTSTFILAASVALIASVPERAPVRWFLEDSGAGALARRVLPFAVTLPILLGWLRIQGQAAGLYGTAFGTALFVIALILLLAAVVLWNLSRISRYELVLRKSEQRTVDTLESVADGFVAFDADWRFTFVNGQAERLMRRSRADLLGRRVEEAVPEMAGTLAHRELRRAASERITVDFEDYNPVLERWFTNKVHPIAGGGMTIAFQDITKRKKAEAEARASRARLRGELVDMKRLQELSIRLVQVGDMTSFLKEILAASADFTGTDKSNIQFYDPADGSLHIVVHQGLGPRFLEHFKNDGCAATCGAAAANAQRVVVEDVSLEPSLQGTADLRVFHEGGIRAIQSTPLLSREGHLLGMLSNHFEAPHRLSEREQRYLDLLARMAADLIERSRSEEAVRVASVRKDEFLAILAHELRNPLSPVRHAAHYLNQQDLSANPGLKQPIEIIDRQTAQLARLVEDLLDVSRISRGLVELRLETVDLREIVGTAVETCREEIDSRGHALAVDLPQEPLPVKADRHRLAQVFCNLLVNAARYTPPRGRIDLSARLERDTLVAEVRDTGIGIPEERIAEIFEPFRQLDSSLQHQGGLGIGLTLARRLITLQRGTLVARSDGPGRGAVFVIRLPIATDPSLPAPGDGAPRAAATPLRILVADDNADAAESLAMLLRMDGHEVRIAADGEAAVGIAADFMPEIALLDVGMPRMNGFDAARLMRQRNGRPDIYLVALTGWGQDGDRARSREAGFDTHLVKPASPETIATLVHQVCLRRADALEPRP